MLRPLALPPQSERPKDKSFATASVGASKEIGFSGDKISNLGLRSSEIASGDQKTINQKRSIFKELLRFIGSHRAPPQHLHFLNALSKACFKESVRL
jgi:hypothetical protein